MVLAEPVLARGLWGAWSEVAWSGKLGSGWLWLWGGWAMTAHSPLDFESLDDGTEKRKAAQGHSGEPQSPA